MRILVFVSVALCAQTLFGQFADGLLRGAIIGSAMAEARASSELMQAEAERIRLETELLKQRIREGQKRSDLGPAVEAVARRFPDVHEFAGEILRLVPVFQRGDLRADQYIEGLYLIARYSSFSQASAVKAKEADDEVLEMFPQLLDEKSRLYQETRKVLREHVAAEPGLRMMPRVLVMAAREASLRLSVDTLVQLKGLTPVRE